MKESKKEKIVSSHEKSFLEKVIAFKKVEDAKKLAYKAIEDLDVSLSPKSGLLFGDFASSDLSSSILEKISVAASDPVDVSAKEEVLESSLDKEIPDLLLEDEPSEVDSTSLSDEDIYEFIEEDFKLEKSFKTRLIESSFFTEEFFTKKELSLVNTLLTRIPSFSLEYSPEYFSAEDTELYFQFLEKEETKKNIPSEKIITTCYWLIGFDKDRALSILEDYIDNKSFLSNDVILQLLFSLISINSDTSKEVLRFFISKKYFKELLSYDLSDKSRVNILVYLFLEKDLLSEEEKVVLLSGLMNDIIINSSRYDNINFDFFYEYGISKELLEKSILHIFIEFPNISNYLSNDDSFFEFTEIKKLLLHPEEINSVLETYSESPLKIKKMVLSRIIESSFGVSKIKDFSFSTFRENAEILGVPLDYNLIDDENKSRGVTTFEFIFSLRARLYGDDLLELGKNKEDLFKELFDEYNPASIIRLALHFPNSSFSDNFHIYLDKIEEDSNSFKKRKISKGLYSFILGETNDVFGRGFDLLKDISLEEAGLIKFLLEILTNTLSLEDKALERLKSFKNIDSIFTLLFKQDIDIKYFFELINDDNQWFWFEKNYERFSQKINDKNGLPLNKNEFLITYFKIDNLEDNFDLYEIILGFFDGEVNLSLESFDEFDRDEIKEIFSNKKILFYKDKIREFAERGVSTSFLVKSIIDLYKIINSLDKGDLRLNFSTLNFSLFKFVNPGWLKDISLSLNNKIKEIKSYKEIFGFFKEFLSDENQDDSTWKHNSLRRDSSLVEGQTVDFFLRETIQGKRLSISFKIRDSRSSEDSDSKTSVLDKRVDFVRQESKYFSSSASYLSKAEQYWSSSSQMYEFPDYFIENHELDDKKISLLNSMRRIKEGGVIFLPTEEAKKHEGSLYRLSCLNQIPVSKELTIYFSNKKTDRAYQGMVRLDFDIDNLPLEDITSLVFTSLNFLDLGEVFKETTDSSRKEFKKNRLKWFLKRKKVRSKLVESLSFEKVFEGYSTYIIPGFSEKLKKKGFKYFYSTMRDSRGIVGALIQGNMSANFRRESGMVRQGVSVDKDISTGGSDYAFLRMAVRGMDSKKDILTSSSVNGSFLIVYDESLADRTDYFCYADDKFGSTEDKEFSKRLSPMGLTKSLKKSYDPSNEVCFRKGVTSEKVKFIFCKSSKDKDSLLRSLEERGITQHHDGRSINEVIKVAITNEMIIKRFYELDIDHKEILKSFLLELYSGNIFLVIKKIFSSGESLFEDLDTDKQYKLMIRIVDYIKNRGVSDIEGHSLTDWDQRISGSSVDSIVNDLG